MSDLITSTEMTFQPSPGGIVERLRISALRRPDCLALAGNRACRHPTLTYAALFREIDRLAAGLLDLGLEPGEHVGLVSENCDLWLLTDLALLSLGAVDVPRGGDTSAQEVAFCLSHAGCRAAVVESPAQVEKLGTARENLRWVMVMKGDPPAGTVGLEDVLQRGDKVLSQDPEAVGRRRATIAPESLATVIYTSGTTGNPKGVMLTHANILHNIVIVPEVLSLRPGGRFLSFLPSWHSFERALEYIVLDSGLELHYSNKWSVREDFLRVRPDFVAGVPRLWETFYNGLIAQLGKLPRPLGALLNGLMEGSRVRSQAVRRLRGATAAEDGRICRATGSQRMGATLLAILLWPPHFLADLLVYRRLRRALGGRVGAAVSGGGPLPAHVDEFMTRAGVPLLNGYGLTESSPVISVRRTCRNVLGTIGLPIPQTEVRIVGDDGVCLGLMRRGVIQARGPQIMRGYLHNETATAEALPGDGWLHTGDVGMLSSDGDLIITGRAKDTIVLRGGENVEPEPLEAEICSSPYVLDAVVVGHGQKTLGVLLVPEFSAVRSTLGLPDNLAEAELARHPGTVELLHREVARRISRQRGYRPFEHIGRVHVLDTSFSVVDGTLTATMKKRRTVIEQRHQQLIQSLFEGS